MLYFARTTNTCRPTIITILQCELQIYIYVYIYPRFQNCLEGVGRLLRNSAIFEVPSYFMRTDADTEEQ